MGKKTIEPVDALKYGHQTLPKHPGPKLNTFFFIRQCVDFLLMTRKGPITPLNDNRHDKYELQT